MPSDNYIIPLTKAYDDKPRTKRANYSVRMIFDFLYKHTRKEKKDIIITEEVNNFIWKNSIQHPPRKVAISLKKKEDKYYVFLKDSENSKKFSVETKEPKKKLKDLSKVTTKKETVETPTKTNQNKEIVKDKNKDEKIDQKSEKIVSKEVPKEQVKKEVPKVENKESIKKEE
jgi:ribosomal protein L31E